MPHQGQPKEYVANPYMTKVVDGRLRLIPRPDDAWEDAHYVYFGRDLQRLGHVKVGCSKSPETRAKRLKLKLFLKIKYSNKVEGRTAEAAFHDGMENWFGNTSRYHREVFQAEERLVMIKVRRVCQCLGMKGL